MFTVRIEKDILHYNKIPYSTKNEWTVAILTSDLNLTMLNGWRHIYTELFNLFKKIPKTSKNAIC